MAFEIDDTFYSEGEHITRHNRYKQYEQIFLGEHEAAFRPTIPENGMYIQEQFGQLISYTSGDLLFGEPVQITGEQAGDDEYFQAWQDDNPDFHTNLFEASLTCSYAGDVLIEMFQDDEGAPHYRFIDARRWMPEMDDEGNVIAHKISFVVPRGERTYLYQRVHRMGLIEHVLYVIVENDKKEQKETGELFSLQKVNIGLLYPGLEPEEQTEVFDDFLVYHVPNMRLVNRLYGLSDYLGKESLMNSLNMLTSYANHILERHTDPIVEVPEGVRDQMQGQHVSDMRLVEVSEELKGTTRYVTWDGHLESLFKQREHVMSMLAAYAEIAPGLLNLKKDQTSVPEAARALRIKYARTLQKIARKRRYWEAAIKYVLTTSQKLQGVDPTQWSVLFADGLPEDYGEYLQDKMLERSLNVQSNESMIREVLQRKGLSNDQIEAEIEQINKERARFNTAPQTASPFKRNVEIDGTGEPAEADDTV